MVFELIVNKLEFKQKNLYITIGLSILYMIVNYISFKISGKEIYPDMTFNNWMTLVYILVGSALLIAGFKLGLWITEKFKKEEK